MKIVIVVGTRPNFIKITQFERVFNELAPHIEYKLIHTGQHYDKQMSTVFFEQLQLKKPDITLNLRDLSPAVQIGSIISSLGEIFLKERPDYVLVVGDVNSTLAAAIAAQKCGVRIGHLESGLRSFDREMPEEINRILTDVICDDYYVTEQSGHDNLINEGVDESRIQFVGNTMIDTLVNFDDKIQDSNILQDLKVISRNYALMTMHRPRNVDTKESLQTLLEIIKEITSKTKLVFPIHPRTLKSFESNELVHLLKENINVVLAPPLDYLAFQKLIAHAQYVITDSGGIQEETTFRKIPCLTLRNNTERPSTVELGSNTLLPYDSNRVNEYIFKIESNQYKLGSIPALWDGKSTERIVSFLKNQYFYI